MTCFCFLFLHIATSIATTSMHTTSCATACVETAASMITKTPLTHANGISCVEATSFLTNDRKPSAGFDPSEVSRVILKPSTFYFLLDACLS